MSPPRVFHLVEGGDTSGFFPQLARWHDRESFPMALGTVYELDPALRDELQEMGVETWSGGARSRRDFPSVAVRLRRHLAGNADILHTHLFEPSLLGLAVARTIPIAAVSTRHHSNYHARMNKRIHVRLDRLITRWSDAVIAVSQHTARVLIEDEGADPQRVHTVPNGIDPSRVQLSDEAVLRDLRASLLGEDGNARLILHPARFHPEKGHYDMFEAIASLHEQEGEPVRLLLAGTGPAREPYERSIERLGIGDQVEFLGFRADIFDLMAVADAVAFPSLAEAFGLALLEAIYVGTPVVATDVGGMPEIVDAVGGAELVPAGDPASLAAVLQATLDRSDGQRDIEAVRARIRDLYSFSRLMSEYEGVYAAVLAERSGPDAP